MLSPPSLRLLDAPPPHPFFVFFFSCLSWMIDSPSQGSMLTKHSLLAPLWCLNPIRLKGKKTPPPKCSHTLPAKGNLQVEASVAKQSAACITILLNLPTPSFGPCSMWMMCLRAKPPAPLDKQPCPLPVLSHVMIGSRPMAVYPLPADWLPCLPCFDGAWKKVK